MNEPVSILSARMPQAIYQIVRKLTQRVAELEAEIDRRNQPSPPADDISALKAALKPFASLWHKSLDARAGGDDAPVCAIEGNSFNVGDVRRAMQLLQEDTSEPTGTI